MSDDEPDDGMVVSGVVPVRLRAENEGRDLPPRVTEIGRLARMRREQGDFDLYQRICVERFRAQGWKGRSLSLEDAWHLWGEKGYADLFGRRFQDWYNNGRDPDVLYEQIMSEKS
jgi:hypothetical protein